MHHIFVTLKVCAGIMLCFSACIFPAGCARHQSEVRLEPIMPPPEPALFVEDNTDKSSLREGYILPVEHPSLRISSKFGARRGGGRCHKGIDLDVPEGVAVVAARSGIATFAGWDGAYGKIIVLGHEEGYETAYAHLCECHVQENEPVEQGQVIGKVGCTGNATGSHLHFELRHNGTPVDPEPWMTMAAK